jgi:hypothetical protein
VEVNSAYQAYKVNYLNINANALIGFFANVFKFTTLIFLNRFDQ